MDITGINNHNHWDRRYLGIYSQFMASMAKVSMSGSLKRTVLWGLWLGVWWGISGNGDFFLVDSWDIMGHRDMINNCVIQCKTNDIQFGADGSKLKWPFVLQKNNWFFGYHIYVPQWRYDVWYEWDMFFNINQPYIIWILRQVEFVILYMNWLSKYGIGWDEETHRHMTI